MKLIFCGGASEVGASCVLVKIAGRNLVFDSGVRMGQNKDFLPDMRMIQENGGVDAIFISHAHMDHIGSLPILSNAFPNARIYMTHATKDLMRVLLYDSLKIMENREQEIPIFSEVHVKNALDRAVCYSPGYTFRPFAESTAVTFYNAGHIAGAVSVYVTGQEGAFFYSGDFSMNPQRTVEGASIPRLRPDVAVFESTYGDRLHSNREIEEQRLIAKVNEVIGAGKKILIPAFALGRAQEVILVLKRAINKGQLPPVKIYVDGMVNDICRVYRQNPNYLNHQLTKRVLKGVEIFYDENIVAVTGRQAQREEIVSSKEPCCIISSSGMLTGGPSQWYASRLAGDEGNLIALTGYQDEEAPGRQLLALAEGDAEERVLKFGDVSVPVNCGIGKYGLSAHADKTEILSLVHSLQPRNAFFIHGNCEVTEQLAKDVQKEFRGRAFAPRNGEEFDTKINVPRKQLVKDDLLTLSAAAFLTEEDIPKLWAFIMDNYQTKRGFTFEELGYIWAGRKDINQEELSKIAQYINNSRYFQAEDRRPFIFRARSEEDIKAEEAPAHMEVNRMLALVEKYFPPETGLYKKGARFDEKIALLSFVFPRKASRFREEIDRFERETEIIKEFAELTGMTMELEYTAPKTIDGNNTAGSKIPYKATGLQMEQNQAMQHIQNAFGAMPDKLYKTSLKTQNNEGYIELSFISPAVGERYRALIEKLESEVNRSIRIGQSVNQHEALNAAKRLLAKTGVEVKKNLAFMPKELQVVAYVWEQPEDYLIIQENFAKLTGLQLIFKTA